MINTIEDYWKLADAKAQQLQAISNTYSNVSVTKLIEDRNHITLVSHLNKIWFALPDNPSIHAIPGFHALCDLCSESWVFDPGLGSSPD